MSLPSARAENLADASVRDFVNAVSDPKLDVRRNQSKTPSYGTPGTGRKSFRLGSRTPTVPKALGGLGFSVLDDRLIGEELGAGDLGLAVIFATRPGSSTPWLTETTTEESVRGASPSSWATLAAFSRRSSGAR